MSETQERKKENKGQGGATDRKKKKENGRRGRQCVSRGRKDGRRRRDVCVWVGCWRRVQMSLGKKKKKRQTPASSFVPES